MRFDLIIIGAGPAGVTLSRLLGEAFSVALLDCRQVDANGFVTEKCCGGILAADAVKWLKHLNLEMPPSVLDSSQPNVIRTVDFQSDQSKLYNCNYINLNRTAFEAWLIQSLPDEVQFLSGCSANKIIKDGEDWLVTANHNGKELEFRTRYVVGADGAGSIVRSSLEPLRSFSSAYLAVQDEFKLSENASFLNEYGVFFDPNLTDFYGWIIPKQDKLLLGIALPPKTKDKYSVTERMDIFKEQVERRYFKLGTKVKRDACLLMRPRARDVFYGKDGAFCIGEAAGWVSPSSAEGFSYAFASAWALAQAVSKEKKKNRATLDLYKNFSFPLRLNIRWKGLENSIIYRPTLRNIIMKTGFLTVKE